MFLKNCWYVAAWSPEVGDKPLARTILNEPVVLFRTGSGKPVAFEDRCVHRRLPLSMGWVVGDTLQCRYHGLMFDQTGRCIKVPGQKTVGEWARLRAYPVVERHKWVFIWMGDPDKVDEALLPGFHARLDDGAWRHFNGTLHIPCNYKLIVDNLLDLSHLAYLHNSSIGNAAMAEEAEVTFRQQGDSVRVVRYMTDIPCSPAFAEFGRYTGNVDRWQVSEYSPPAYFLVNNGTDPAGAVDLPKEERILGQGKWGFHVYHAVTPESDTSSFQFWAFAHRNGILDPSQYQRFTDICAHQVMAEDVEAYTQQQKVIEKLDPGKARLGEVGALGEIRADTGLMMARRILDGLLAKERSSQRAGPVRDRPG